MSATARYKVRQMITIVITKTSEEKQYATIIKK